MGPGNEELNTGGEEPKRAPYIPDQYDKSKVLKEASLLTKQRLRNLPRLDAGDWFLDSVINFISEDKAHYIRQCERYFILRGINEDLKRISEGEPLLRNIISLETNSVSLFPGDCKELFEDCIQIPNNFAHLFQRQIQLRAYYPLQVAIATCESSHIGFKEEEAAVVKEACDWLLPNELPFRSERSGIPINERRNAAAILAEDSVEAEEIIDMIIRDLGALAIYALVALDDMNIAGAQIPIAYNRVYNRDLKSFITSVVQRSPALVATLNEIALTEGITETAILYGARSLCLKD